MTPEQMNQRIAATLEAMRIEQHRSLKSLAKVAGCSPATLRRKLDGKNLTASDAVVIARELGESLAQVTERIEREALDANGIDGVRPGHPMEGEPMVNDGVLPVCPRCASDEVCANTWEVWCFPCGWRITDTDRRFPEFRAAELVRREHAGRILSELAGR